MTPAAPAPMPQTPAEPRPVLAPQGTKPKAKGGAQTFLGSAGGAASLTAPSSPSMGGGKTLLGS